MDAPGSFDQFVPRLHELFEEHRDPVRAAAMGAYMRDQFPFLGIPSPEQKTLTREARARLATPTQTELVEASLSLWADDEREYQYAAVELLIANVGRCNAGLLPHVRQLLVTKSWWDTVDALASRVVGPLVAAFPELRTEIDAWAGSENLWLARAAILHQLGFKGRTDTDRLLGYCLQRSGDTDFFMRKAIGWALREYSKTDPDTVTRFVETNTGSLSSLTRREALLWLRGGRKKRTAGE